MANSLPLVHAWASRALEGDISGDLHVVTFTTRGALLAVIDGLGHGVDAASAAREAATILEAEAEQPLRELISLCHQGMSKTRGAVMTVVSLDVVSGTLEWCGVGNVEGVLVRVGTDRRKGESVVARGGVVGYRLPPLKVTATEIAPGDMLVLATDGIRSGFADSIEPECEPQFIADRILERYGRGTDDALVLVARYQGAHWP